MATFLILNTWPPSLFALQPVWGELGQVTHAILWESDNNQIQTEVKSHMGEGSFTVYGEAGNRIRKIHTGTIRASFDVDLRGNRFNSTVEFEVHDDHMPINGFAQLSKTAATVHIDGNSQTVPVEIHISNGGNQLFDFYVDTPIFGRINFVFILEMTLVGTLKSDLRANCKIDFADFLLVSKYFGSDATGIFPSPEDEEGVILADINGDNLVNLADFQLLKNEYGLECPG